MSRRKAIARSQQEAPIENPVTCIQRKYMFDILSTQYCNTNIKHILGSNKIAIQLQDLEIAYLRILQVQQYPKAILLYHVPLKYCGLWTLDYRLWTLYSGFGTMDYGLQIFWEILHNNGNSELTADWHMRLHRKNTEHAIILTEEYCEEGIQDVSDVTIMCYMY